MSICSFVKYNLIIAAVIAWQINRKLPGCQLENYLFLGQSANFLNNCCGQSIVVSSCCGQLNITVLIIYCITVELCAYVLVWFQSQNTDAVFVEFNIADWHASLLYDHDDALIYISSWWIIHINYNCNLKQNKSNKCNKSE